MVPLKQTNLSHTFPAERRHQNPSPPKYSSPALAEQLTKIITLVQRVDFPVPRLVIIPISIYILESTHNFNLIFIRNINCSPHTAIGWGCPVRICFWRR